MSFKAYHVLVPKAAVADPGPPRAEAALLALDCGLSPWQRWWTWRVMNGFSGLQTTQRCSSSQTTVVKTALGPWVLLPDCGGPDCLAPNFTSVPAGRWFDADEAD
jgi:hypothetical protein